MTITLSKPIAIIILVCLAIIVICDLLLAILKLYQKRLDEKEKKYEIAIGKYDEELNQKNKSIAIGQSKTADKRGEE